MEETMLFLHGQIRVGDALRITTYHRSVRLDVTESETEFRTHQ